MLETSELTKFIGRSVDGFTLAERWDLIGVWVALELYSPQRLPLRVIEAIGYSSAQCIEQIKARGLDPGRYHYEQLAAPYEL